MLFYTLCNTDTDGWCRALLVIYSCLFGGAFLSASRVPELEERTVFEFAAVSNNFCSRQCLERTGNYDAIGTQ